MSPETFRKLVALGLSHDQMAGVLEIFDAETKAHEDAEEARKAQGRERWHRWNDKRNANVSKREQTLANDLRAGDARAFDNLQTKNLAGQEERKKDAPEARSVPSFPDFWTLYPNKVGKRDAEAAFAKALKRAPLETILTGLRRYAAKTDDRPWCNPATWLNQDRWDDAPAAVATSHRATAPPGKQTVGQQARDELKRMGFFDASDSQTRHDDKSDRGPDFAGNGFSRRIAIAGGG